MILCSLRENKVVGESFTNCSSRSDDDCASTAYFRCVQMRRALLFKASLKEVPSDERKQYVLHHLSEKSNYEMELFCEDVLLLSNTHPGDSAFLKWKRVWLHEYLEYRKENKLVFSHSRS